MKQPCAEKPDDWFISADGKQYPDDEFLSEREVRTLMRDRDPGEGRKAVQKAERDRRTAALGVRRRAKEACIERCPKRFACLDLAMSDAPHTRHGIWGGYYPEELARMKKNKRERARRAASRN